MLIRQLRQPLFIMTIVLPLAAVLSFTTTTTSSTSFLSSIAKMTTSSTTKLISNKSFSFVLKVDWLKRNNIQYSRLSSLVSTTSRNDSGEAEETKKKGFGKLHNSTSKKKKKMSKSNKTTIITPQNNDEKSNQSSSSSSTKFKALLRDLQIQNVPLLQCDANQVSTFMAAVWTTMSELSETATLPKMISATTTANNHHCACLILENVPINAIRAFVQDFTILKMQRRLMQYMPELERIHVSILGGKKNELWEKSDGENIVGSIADDIGPAIIIEIIEEDTKKENDNEMIETSNAIQSVEEIEGEVRQRQQQTQEEKVNAAIQLFVQRMVVNESICPYTKNVNVAPTGLEGRGIQPSTVGYRKGMSSDACAALASFWTCICELQSTPQDQLSTIVLSLPSIGMGRDKMAHDRFVAVVELISRNLCLFRGDNAYGLVHFHPAYNRSTIHPIDKPAYGHLPPRGWLRAMMRFNGNTKEAELLSDAELQLSDYQRRSPHTAINILRVPQINAAAGGKSIVDLTLDDGSTEKASGITTYSRNAIRLAEIGEGALEKAALIEYAMVTR